MDIQLFFGYNDGFCFTLEDPRHKLYHLPLHGRAILCYGINISFSKIVCQAYPTNCRAEILERLPSEPSRHCNVLIVKKFQTALLFSGVSFVVHVLKTMVPTLVPVASTPYREYSLSWNASEVITPSDG